MIWYDEAQNILLDVGAGGALLALLTHILWRPKYLKIIVFTAGAFIFGLYLGIGVTARGSFFLPFAVMQQQLHQEWGLRYYGANATSGIISRNS